MRVYAVCPLRYVLLAHPFSGHFYPCKLDEFIWAATWQNQQHECAPSEDSDQPRHPPSLIWVFAVRMKKPWVLSYSLSAQGRLWSDWADAQADPSLRRAHSGFVGFVMLWLICHLRGVWVCCIKWWPGCSMFSSSWGFLTSITIKQTEFRVLWAHVWY